jgi:Bacteriocin-protection, YdeI or OmpD-Associated/Domain of unknown function (DUF1905)
MSSISFQARLDYKDAISPTVQTPGSRGSRGSRRAEPGAGPRTARRSAVRRACHDGPRTGGGCGDRYPAWPWPCHDKAMRVQRFGARIAADPRGRAAIVVPFDPDEAWGAKARHHVHGTVNGCRVRVTIAPGDSGWAFPLNPRMGIAAGSDVIVELAPEGPQRGDLADDISAALDANPAAAAFFDTLAQFYRKAYLRYIDATTRRPDLRAARIAEVVDLLADGIKERPRS